MKRSHSLGFEATKYFSHAKYTCFGTELRPEAHLDMSEWRKKGNFRDV